MILGLTQDVEIATVSKPSGEIVAQACSPEIKVIGVICSGDLSVHRDIVKQALQRGIEQRPDAVWVCIEPKSDRMTHDLMISLGIEPVILPLNDEWRRRPSEGEVGGSPSAVDLSLQGYDFRRVWRDNEMLMLCDELIVFHKRSGNSPWRDRAASGLYGDRLVVVELGKDKPKAKKSA